MAKLRVPSLQHLARNWRPDAERVKWQLVELVNNPPTFNYTPLYGAVRDLLVFRQPYEEVVRGIERYVRRDDVRENFLEVLPLLSEHFARVSPDFVQSVERRYYAVSRDLLVPFEPPILYGIGGRLYFPWLSFWRSNPLASERLSLFVTIVEDILLRDPDFEQATFEILDFSVQARGEGRELSVIDSREIPRLTEMAKTEMLRVFAEGYLMAEAELSRKAAAKDSDGATMTDFDPDQPGLFE